MATLASNNAYCVKFLATTTVPNKSIARLMENLSECREKRVAFLIASLPQAQGRMMTTPLGVARSEHGVVRGGGTIVAGVLE
jgi:hypothetical protein